MAKIVDVYGNPLQSQVLSEPQSETAHVAHLQREFAGHPSRNLTPVKLSRILESAELGNLQGQSELFMDMEERDAHLFAEISKRKRVLAAIDWRIVPPRNPSAQEKADAGFLTEMVAEIEGWEELLLDMADGIGHGFSTIEFEWERLGREHRVRKFHHRPQTWFKLPSRDQDTLRLRSNNSDGEALAPFGWMVHRPKARSGYIARTGLFRVLAWPYLFKHYATRDLAELLEIYGLPIRLGSYPPGTGDPEKATLLRAVIQLGHSAAGIIPEGMKIDFQKAAEGSEAPFLSMMRECDNAISKAVLGGTLTTQTSDGGGGAYALGKVHDDVRQDLKAADARQLAGSLSRDLLWPLLVLNRPGASDPHRAPRLVFDVDDPEERAQAIRSIEVAVKTGVDVPLAWARTKLGIPEPQNGEPVLSRPVAQPAGTAALTARAPLRTAAVATSDQAALDAVLAGLPADRLQGQAEQLAEPLLAALRNGADDSELLGLLGEAYPAMHSDDMQELLERLLFAADLVGRLSARDELGLG